MTDDLYAMMLREHPVQKEHRVLNEMDSFHDVSGGLFGVHEHTWLPRQEDWQTIYEKNTIPVLRRVEPKATINEYDHLKELFPKYEPLALYQTLRWCLFVSREVYSIEWDWEARKWR